jgi:hypothetical protein
MNFDKLPLFLKHNLDSFIAATVGFIIIYLFTRHGGIGISPDSIVYTSVARNLVAGNGFMQYTGSPVVDFPVFYPLFLSLVMLITGKDIITCAPFLNGLMFASVILLAGIIMERFKYHSKWYKWILLALIAFSPSLIEIYTMLWSETLFILLSLVFLLAMHHYLRVHSWPALMMAAIVAALAFDTRYAGITCIGTGVMLIVFDKNLRWKQKAAHSSVFTVIGISIVASNLIRNALTTGLATGMRQKGITPLEKNIEYSGSVLSDWVNFSITNHLFFELLAIIIMGLFIFFFIRNVRRWKSYYTFENATVAFFMVYVGFIILSSTISRYETINNRLLSPAFMPLLWGSTCLLPKWRANVSGKKRKWLFLFVTLILGIFMCGSYISATHSNYSDMKDSGIPGYTEDPWTQSPTIRFLQHQHNLLDPDSTVYSNHNQAIYFFTGYPTETVPERVYTQDVNEFKEESPIVLVWFYLDPNTDLLSLEEIARIKRMRRLYTFPDGAIYLLTNFPELPNPNKR